MDEKRKHVDTANEPVDDYDNEMVDTGVLHEPRPTVKKLSKDEAGFELTEEKDD